MIENARTCIEERVQVRGLELALKIWGDATQPPVLALHGWLDNAASFDRLAPLLADYRLIALDLPGHGLSAHRPQQGTYNIWDDLPDLLALVDALGIDRLRLLGHSRGAIMSLLLAAALGDRIQCLALLDGLLPRPLAAADFPAQLRRFVHDYGSSSHAKPRVYAEIEDAVQARCRANGTDAVAARPIVVRNLKACAGGWCWRTDPRLRLASAMKLSEAHIAAVLESVDVPGLLVLASEGLGANKDFLHNLDHFEDLQLETIAGEHHWHMLEPAAAIAGILNKFFASVPQ